jgi:hypothetical protein
VKDPLDGSGPQGECALGEGPDPHIQDEGLGMGLVLGSLGSLGPLVPDCGGSRGPGRRIGPCDPVVKIRFGWLGSQRNRLFDIRGYSGP